MRSSGRPGSTQLFFFAFGLEWLAGRGRVWKVSESIRDKGRDVMLREESRRFVDLEQERPRFLWIERGLFE